jgi:hypothetical protein
MDISGAPAEFKKVPFSDFKEWMDTVHRSWARDRFNFVIYHWIDNGKRFAYTQGEWAWVDPSLLK